ncbi:MAG: tail fiber domain-containing protein, partial [Bacteroidales bacterium]
LENTNYTPISKTSWFASDRLFVIGNGNVSRSDALVVLKNGNVGIGTSTPSRKLEVIGTTKSVTRTGAADAAGQFQAWTDGSGQSLKSVYSFYPTFEGSSDNGPRRAADIVGGFNGGAWTTEYLSFNVGLNGANDDQKLTNERMRITGNGNVGIGTSFPQSTLHLKGNGGMLNLEGTDHGYIQWFPQGFAAGRKAYIGFPGALSTDMVIVNQFTTGSDNIILQPGTNGNVGIGTNTPLAKLEIDEGSGDRLAFYRYADNTLIVQTLLDGVPLSTYNTYAGDTENRLILQPLVGNVGIGTFSPAYKFTVNGMTWCSAGAWTGSDLRWKKDIAEINDVLSNVLTLKPVTYQWKTDEFPEMNFKNGTQIGLIAQDVEKVFPSLVLTDNKGYKAVSYEKLSVILLEGMKEQQKQIEGQQNKIEFQQKEIDELKTLVNSLIANQTAQVNK